MAKIDIEVPDTLNPQEVQQIKDWFGTRSNADWLLFKENFKAFISSLRNVCRNFWHKICDWAAGLWERIKSIF